MAKRKYKSKLDKLLETDCDASYITTPEDCQKWFKILNREIFYNTLVTPSEIDIRWRRGAYAYYDAIIDTEDSTYIHTILCMNKKYKSKKFFVEVLAHELVHHYQFLTEGKADHGKTFMAWTDTFNKKGLRLVKAY
jgi:hypothetical protein